MAVTKTTTFSESNISVANNTSSLSIKIYFSANNNVTWFESATLSCTCNGTTKSATVSHAKGGSTTHTFTFKNIAHNTDGSKSVNWSWRCATDTSVLGTLTASGTKTLTKINRQATLSSAPNFNDEQNPTITYSNPAGNSVNSLMACISLTGSTDDIAYRNISKTGTSYTFNLTEAERNVLRNACRNSTSLSVKFFVRTNISGTNYHSSLAKTMTIVNGNPTFSDFEYEDINPVTRSITNSNQEIILGYSTLQITIAGNNKATPKKGASINYYLINGRQYTYSDNFVSSFANWNNPIAEVTAVDTRGLSTPAPKNLTIASYLPLQKGDITVTRDGNIGEETKLSYNGVMQKLLPNGQNNTITVSYKYKKTTEENYTTSSYSITPTIDSNGNFSFDNYITGDTIDGFDINYSYNIVVEISDVLSTISYSVTLNSGIPAISVKENNMAFHGVYNSNDDANIQMNGIAKLNGGRIYGEYVLYDDASGDNGTIQLSDNASNYTYIEIFYRSNDTDYSSVKVYSPNGKRVSLFIARANFSTPRVYQKTRTIYINGTSVSTYNTNTVAEFTNNNNSAGTIVGTNNIWIIRVVGYK